MAVVKYFYVSVILCPFAVKGERKTEARKNCGILSVGGFYSAHSCGQ